MATVREVRTMLSPLSDAEVTKTEDAVHVKGFVTTPDLEALVVRYHVFLHSNGALCVE